MTAILIILARLIEYSTYMYTDYTGNLKRIDIGNVADSVAMYTKLEMGFFQAASMAEVGLRIKFTAAKLKTTDRDEVKSL